MNAVWRPLPLIIGFLLLLTYLLLQSRSPDLALRARMHEALGDFELHGAQLDRDVLRARAGLLNRYDSVARAVQDLTRTLSLLRRESQAATGAAASVLGARVEAMEQALREKRTLVEHFKSDNALLRNSLGYVNFAGQTLHAKAVASDADAIVAALGALANALLRFMETPTDNVGKEIETLLDRLPAPPLQVELESIAAHGRLIIQVLPRVDAELRQIMAASTTADARLLQDALVNHYGEADRRAQIYRSLLYSVAVLLLAYLFFLLVRLRLNALHLRRVNTHLRQEIADRRQAEQALRTSEERLRAITESANEAIVSMDRQGAVISWNAGATALFGYAPDEALGSPFDRLVPPDQRGTYAQAVAEWSRTGHSPLAGATIELYGVRKDGGEFPLQMSLATWHTAEGAYLTGIIHDLTERKRLEEKSRRQELQLIQANKMTALGTLVSSVAHEINNPNQLVLMNARVLADAWNDAVVALDEYERAHGDLLIGGLAYNEMRDTLPTLAQDMHDGARRIERIINDLKDFTRPHLREIRGAFQLNEAVQRALRLLTHLISKKTSRFRVDLAADLPLIQGDPQRIEQVIVNLIVNALEALPDPEHGVTVSTRTPAEGQVMFAVRDEGVGISQEHLLHICDPFFTTKADSGGTGLGLAIASELVRSSGGQLCFQSERGKGTLAIMTLPHAAAVIRPSGAVAPA
jgi:PAS domain S-box-containing protein